MISWEDVYKVLVAMAPLYAALALGYGSVRWWHMFKPEHCDAINRFACYFIFPFFTFEFICYVNPYKLNFRFLSADVISKCIVGIALAVWANFSSKGNLPWSITAFSLSSINNTLIVGVPLLEAMYGQLGKDLVIQSSLIQALVWLVVLLFMLEVNNAKSNSIQSRMESREEDRRSVEMANNELDAQPELEQSSIVLSRSQSFWTIIKIICFRVAMNPNSYACFVGLVWGLMAYRWKFHIPSIIEGSILIMAKAGGGVAMFNMGLFMALQEKLIAGGVRNTLVGMILRFVVGPATMAIGSLAMGLRGNAIKIAVVQAALPQAVTTFVYANEYGLHADVLSTAVIFGTMVSLPVLIAYYAVLDTMP